MEPVPTLLRRMREELAEDFDPCKPIRISRAPGRLDVMGGIAEYTGSLVCEMTLDRAAAVAIQSREDRNVQIFSFNLFDEHLPFTFRVPLNALADSPIETLRAEFNQPGRKWAGYIAGCLAILHRRNQIDLKNTALRGINLALYSTIPIGAGIGSSAAIEVATMINLMDHFQIRRNDPLLLASMCQEVENQIIGVPSGIKDQLTSCAGNASGILRMICQPHEIQPPLEFPLGIRAVGINSNVKRDGDNKRYVISRCAAFMGHRMILEKMRELGNAAGRTLQSDPMQGYLANLDPEDYKRLFRPFLPPQIDGKTFLEQFNSTIDGEIRVDPNQTYNIVQACDHHVLEARRVRNFALHLETAAKIEGNSPARKLALDKAGHLMYASHLSYTNDALLGAPECDLLVKLSRDRESAGLYGARITANGCGGTVAILADISTRADAAINEIMAVYEQQTGHKPEAFTGASPGAWTVGTAIL
jgi:galactokinase